MDSSKDNDFILKNMKNLPEIFELVRDLVYKSTKLARRGLMLGLTDLGDGKNAWFGGYHNIASNAIIMNSRPMNYIKKHHPDLYNSYICVVLMHEYIHTLGYHDEISTRSLTLKIIKTHFNNETLISMAEDINKFIPKFQNATYGWIPSLNPHISYVFGFDESSASYYV